MIGVTKGTASLVAQLINDPPAVQETWVRSLGWEDSLEKGMNGFSILAWRIPWTVVHGVIKSQTQKSDFDFASLHQGEEKGNIMFRL